MAKNIQVALTKFEEAAIKHTEATDQGDYKTGNKCYTIIFKSISFLKEHDELQKLAIFLDHSSDGVKGWAATYLLPIVESDAIHVLENIAKGNGIRSLAAETTLKEWRKGNLKL